MGQRLQTAEGAEQKFQTPKSNGDDLLDRPRPIVSASTLSTAKIYEGPQDEVGLLYWS